MKFKLKTLSKAGQGQTDTKKYSLELTDLSSRDNTPKQIYPEGGTSVVTNCIFNVTVLYTVI